MSSTVAPSWETKRTPETRMVEELLRCIGGSISSRRIPIVTTPRPFAFGSSIRSLKEFRAKSGTLWSSSIWTNSHRRRKGIS